MASLTYSSDPVFWNYGAPVTQFRNESRSMTYSSTSPETNTDDTCAGETITDKFCLICNAPNASPHYGTLSCMSCKAFFRRCVRKNSQEKCISGNNACIMTVQYRSRCRSCRFRACLAVGMKREGVSLIPQPSPKKKPKLVTQATKTSSVLDQSSFTSPSTVTSSGATTSIENLYSDTTSPLVPTTVSRLPRNSFNISGCGESLNLFFPPETVSDYGSPPPPNERKWSADSASFSSDPGFGDPIEESAKCNRNELIVSPYFEMGYATPSAQLYRETIKPDNWISDWLRYYQHVDHTPNQNVYKLTRFLKNIEFTIDDGLFNRPAIYKRATIDDFVEQFESHMQISIEHLKDASLLTQLPLDDQVTLFHEAFLPAFLFTVANRSLQFENALLISQQRGFVATDSISPVEFGQYVNTLIQEIVVPLKKLQLDEFESMTLTGILVWNPDLMHNPDAQALVCRVRQHLCSGLESYVFNKRMAGRLSAIVYFVNKIQGMLAPTRRCFSQLIKSGQLQAGPLFQEVALGYQSRAPTFAIL